MGYSMLLQTLQGKSILAHFSCPYALVVFKHHTIYRKNYCFIDRFCCRSLTAPYENGNISVKFKFADELRKIAEYIEINTTEDTAVAG